MRIGPSGGGVQWPVTPGRSDAVDLPSNRVQRARLEQAERFDRVDPGRGSGASPGVQPPPPPSPLPLAPGQDSAQFLAAYQEQFAALSTNDQDAYRILDEKLASDPSGRSAMAALLARGSIGSTDTTGKTMMWNLSQLAAQTTPLQTSGAQPGDTKSVEPMDLVHQTLMATADPDGTLIEGQPDGTGNIAQRAFNTCGATTIEYLLATQQPAEFARVVTGLTGPSGKVTLQGGAKLQRVPDSVGKDPDSKSFWQDGSKHARTDIDRVLQAAFMNQEGTFRGGYSNETDRYKNPPPKLQPTNTGNPIIDVWHRLENAAQTAVVNVVNGAVEAIGYDVGMGENGVADLYQQVLGRKCSVIGDVGNTGLLAPEGDFDGVTIGVPGNTHQDVVNAVLGQLQAGKPLTVDIIIAPEGSFVSNAGGYSDNPIDRSKVPYPQMMSSAHQIWVTGIHDGIVTYRNPWGFTATMSLGEFESRLTDAVIPKD